MKEKVLTGYPSIDRLHERNLSYFQKNPIIPNMSISNTITLLNLFNMNNDAVDMTKLRATYFEMENSKRIMARAFMELGIKKGDTITVCMDNIYQAIVTFLAANMIGATVAILNYRASKEEVVMYLNEFESPLLVNYNRNQEYNEKIKNNTSVREIITLKEENLYSKLFLSDKANFVGYSDYIDFNDLKIIASYYKKHFRTLYDGKETALLSFTSGSSGKPKTVELTNENILANGIYCKNTINLPQSKRERCLSFVPFKYPYGFCTSVLLTLLCGRTIVLSPDGLTKENASSVLKDINYYYGSPALIDVLKNVVPSSMDLSSGHTFVTGGDFFTSKIEASGQNFFHEHNNDHIVFCNGAGNAETVATWSSSVGTKIRPGTVGKILVGSDPLVVNPDTMQEVKYGEEGRLLISGKHVFKGYYKNKDLTNEETMILNAKRRYNTRTIGSLDQDGYFTLTGRESRFYILNDGNKVYCEKIQNIISLIDIVDMCVVVPKENKNTRFEAKAYIVLKDGVFPDEETRQYIYSRMTEPFINEKGEKLTICDFEIPASIDFVNELKRTSADKIDYLYYEHMAQEEFEQEKHKEKIYCK